ncbi:MAG: alpha/beta hydrolase [Rikenellaceae bacterium]
MKKITNSLLFVSVLSLAITATDVSAQSLSKKNADKLTETLIKERQEKSVAEYGSEWENRELTNGEYKMKFFYKIFGEMPEDGRAMYITMHGGGGTKPEANDKQWENQKKLYTPQEGVYFVPRSPTNSWNMWHQGYMDGFIEKAIELAVINEGVNPNKVYIMGYSAGGDGTYQLAPRLADLWAAAAMSAGHPGDAQIESLRNLPFALYMGGKDTPYKRNDHARKWKIKHDSLSTVDEGAYIHDIKIFEQYEHWMMREDSVSMSWMPKFKRNTIPNKVVWIQDNIIRDKFYWLEATEDGKKQHQKVVVSYEEGRVDILEAAPASFIVGLNDKMMNLDKKVAVYYQGKEIFNGKVTRSAKNIEDDVNKMRDTDLVFPVKLKITNNETVEVIE